MRKRSLAPEGLETVHELVGRRRFFAERDHICFDLLVRLALELAGAVMVGANGVVDRLGGLTKIGVLRQGIGTAPGDQERAAARKREFMRTSGPWCSGAERQMRGISETLQTASQRRGRRERAARRGHNDCGLILDPEMNGSEGCDTFVTARYVTQPETDEDTHRVTEQAHRCAS